MENAIKSFGGGRQQQCTFNLIHYGGNGSYTYEYTTTKDYDLLFVTIYATATITGTYELVQDIGSMSNTWSAVYNCKILKNVKSGCKFTSYNGGTNTGMSIYEIILS